MTDLQGPLFVATGNDAPRPGLPFVDRKSITAIVRDRRTRKYLILRWKKADWTTFVTGGIKPDESAKDAARRETHKETGYKHLCLVAELPPYHSKFYHRPKAENRFGHFQSFLFELTDGQRDPVSEDERAKHESAWIDEAEVRDLLVAEGHRYLLDHIQKLRL